MKTKSPWELRFIGLDDKSIEDRTRIAPHPIGGLSSFSRGTASEKLRVHLEAIFLASPQGVRVIREIVHTAWAYAQEEYPDAKEFMARLYNDEYIPLTRPAICVTGLAGGGKSAIMRAIGRLIPDDECDAIAGHQLPRRAFAFVAVKQHDTEAAVFRSLHELIGCSTIPRSTEVESTSKPSRRQGRLGSVNDAMRLAQRGAFRDGFTGILLDELQFLAQSGATARISKTLLLLSYVGPPLVYAANFDMVHGLKARAQQYRDRLLSRPIVLLPDSIWDSEEFEGWILYLSEVLRVADGALEFDAKDDAERLHRYSFGLRRKLVLLLTEAYRHAREHKRQSAKMPDIEWAYKSVRYEVHRDDVESLQASEIGTKTKRRDLHCPFEIDPDVKSGRTKFYLNMLHQKTAEDAVAASLSPAEKRALQRMKERAAEGKGDTPKPKPERKPRMEPVSATSLATGMGRFTQTS